MSRLAEAQRGLDTALPGPGACAPRLFATPERSTWRPADAQPGPPHLPGPGDPTDVHRGAHSLPGPTGWRHLSPGAHAAVRPPPSQAAPGSLSLAAWPAEALRWQHSELLGQPCCWKAQSPCPGLGHGCAGAVQKGPTEASVPPGQRQPPAPHSGRAVAACPRGLSPHPGGQASWHPAQRASLLTGGCRGPRCAPRPGAWRAGVEGWLVKHRDGCWSRSSLSVWCAALSGPGGASLGGGAGPPGSTGTRLSAGER